MDKQEQMRNITVYKVTDTRGVKKDVDAKAFYPDGSEVLCTDDTPPQSFEVGNFTCQP